MCRMKQSVFFVVRTVELLPADFWDAGVPKMNCILWYTNGVKNENYDSPKDRQTLVQDYRLYRHRTVRLFLCSTLLVSRIYFLGRFVVPYSSDHRIYSTWKSRGMEVYVPPCSPCVSIFWMDSCPFSSGIWFERALLQILYAVVAIFYCFDLSVHPSTHG